MNLEGLSKYCRALPGTTEDVRWGELIFSTGGRAYCSAPAEGKFSIIIKVNDAEFDKLVAMQSIIPAPFLEESKWVEIGEGSTLADAELEVLISRSYQLIKDIVAKEFNG